MRTDSLIELILLILFFVISPLLRRMQARRAPTAGAPGPPGPAGPTPRDYAASVAQQVQTLTGQIGALRAHLQSSPLLAAPDLADPARRLVARADAAIDRAAQRLAGAQRAGASPMLQAIELSRWGDAIRAELARARSIDDLLGALAEQRLDPQRRALMDGLDGVVARLALRRASDLPARRRLALVWEGDPLLPPLWLGAGDIGLVPIGRAVLRSASGWATLAQGVGYDLMGQLPGLVDELRNVVRVGPLAARPAAQSSLAGSQFDMAAALWAWTPDLAADVVATALLGRPYSLALIRLAADAGVGPQECAAIRARAGRYDSQPPLLARLAVIDEALDKLGWADPDGGLEALRRRLGWPREAVYVLPNQMTRRLQLDPLLGFLQQVGGALVSARPESAGRRRLDELLRSSLSPVDEPAFDVVRRALLTRKSPAGGDVLTLLGGAVLAEADAEAMAARTLFLDAVLRASRGGVAPHIAAAAPDWLADRALMRDAIVLAEIL